MQRGFTLVELAIVLVIIGLIIGGVLVGRDLIKAAEIRAVASDIQKYNTGVAAFQLKYNGIPGDLLSTAATNFGLTVSVVSPGTRGNGDGNGMIESSDGSGICPVGLVGSPVSGLGGETTLFWRQLSDAKMIPGSYNGDGTCIDTTSFGTAGVAETTLVPLLPELRIRKTAFISVAPYQGAGGAVGRNNYFVASFVFNDTFPGQLGTSAILSPREAQGIDQKLDDGFPRTGTVIARGTGGSPVTSSDTYCYDNSTAQGAYATSSEDIANGIRCALVIKAGF